MTKSIKNTQIILTTYTENEATEVTIDEPSELEMLDKKKWINIVGLADKSAITTLLQHYNIHPLVIEDIFNTEQRPKIDYFDDYSFIVVKIQLKKHSFVQFSFILLADTIISLQDINSNFFTIVKQRLNMKGTKARKNGVDYLLYLMLDSLVDNQFAVVEAIEDKVDDLEECFLKDQQSLSLSSIYKLKREVMYLRKKLSPLRDCLSSILKSESEFFEQQDLVYFRDVYDHTLQLNESLDGQREMLVTLLEIYLSSVNNKMNQTMKVLTMFAAIFIPLSFIASLYGMNFTNMPELKWHYGYYVTLAGMASIGTGLLLWFKKKKWF
jgi:magnesium transporter